MNKTFNNKAWWMVLPVFLVVAFNALIPLMTVVNYSVQETFGNNEFFWSGTIWFQQLLENDQIRDSLGRQITQGVSALPLTVPKTAARQNAPWLAT